MSNSTKPRVGVVLVNWRGWRDTLLALETLYGSDYPTFDVVVVDNDSGDESVEHIQAWVESRETVVIPKELVGRVRARIADCRLDYTVINEESACDSPPPIKALTIIRAEANRGFAAGNNLGLAYLRRHGNYDYFWLLNNDAFPAPDALAKMVGRALEDPSLGQIGATLIYAGRPDVIQALGGAVFDPKTGRAYHVGAESSVVELESVQAPDIEKRMSYIVGASILVSERFLARIGLMEESYFLYFEELDWAARGKAEFGLGYAPAAMVYHKAGGSTQKKSRRSELAAYYLARNRIIVTKRFFPDCIVSVMLGLTSEILKYVARARWAEAKGYFRALGEAFGHPFGNARP